MLRGSSAIACEHHCCQTFPLKLRKNRTRLRPHVISKHDPAGEIARNQPDFRKPGVRLCLRLRQSYGQGLAQPFPPAKCALASVPARLQSLPGNRSKLLQLDRLESLLLPVTCDRTRQWMGGKLFE